MQTIKVENLLPRSRVKSRLLHQLRIFIRNTVIGMTLLAAGLAFVLSPIIGQPFYDYILFYPLKYPGGYYNEIKANGIAPEDCYFQSDNGNKLHGLMYKLPGASKIMLFSHGNGGNVSFNGYIINRLLQAGTSVFCYDYSGYGHSEGKPSLRGLYEDGHGAYKYLLYSKDYRTEQIIFFGASLGTVVAGKLAAENACAAVILECPLYSLQRVGCDRLPFLKWYPDFAWSKNCQAYNNALVLSKKHPPVLMLAGTADTITRIEQSDALYKAMSEPKRYVRVDGAEHGDDRLLASAAGKRALHEFLAPLK